MSVLTVGETMVLLDPVGEGGLELGGELRLRVAGAESNFAIALSRLGVPVTWVSRLGTDPLGDLVHGALEREGLDLRYVERDADAPTGLFLKWRTGGRTRVLYYRSGSAASRLAPRHVPAEALAGVALVHVTGITLALGVGARALVAQLARSARRAGARVLFDPNWRSPLWRGPREAAAAQREVLPYVDWYLCGLEEGNLLFETESAEELVAAVREAGARDAVVRVGERGALVREEGGSLREVPPPRLAAVLDEVGAGDGFAAGFAFGLLRDLAPADCARTGNALAAAALRGTGDWETFPYLHELERLGDAR
ncbi:MAG: sugar kinase [Thermoleophilia bacterium]|nr:sugar kinase [Thermoleophilia bacterium]